jgi:hypothetical protein
MEVHLRIGEDADPGATRRSSERRTANRYERQMTDGPDDLDEVRRRVEEIQRRKRGRIQWRIGRHTAELAIGAIEKPPRPPRNGKSRRRKRKKRLL